MAWGFKKGPKSSKSTQQHFAIMTPVTGNMAGSQRQESLLTCDILGNGLTLLLLKTEQCQPRLQLRLIISPWKVLLPYEKAKILLSSAAEDNSLMLEEKFQQVPFQNMHNLAKLGRNEKCSRERWSTILWKSLRSTARKRKSQKMNDQWVEFQERNKIWEANTSVCEQINQQDITLSAGKHAQGITKGPEGQSLQWLSTSRKQSSKPGPHTRHVWWTWHSTKCSSAQAKAVTAAAEQTKEGLEEREVAAEDLPIMLDCWGQIQTYYKLILLHEVWI